MDFDPDDMGNAGWDEDAFSPGRRRPPAKARWSWSQYLALTVAGFALVCVVWAVLSELLG